MKAVISFYLFLIFLLLFYLYVKKYLDTKKDLSHNKEYNANSFLKNNKNIILLSDPNTINNTNSNNNNNANNNYIHTLQGVSLEHPIIPIAAEHSSSLNNNSNNNHYQNHSNSNSNRNSNVNKPLTPTSKNSGNSLGLSNHLLISSNNNKPNYSSISNSKTNFINNIRTYSNINSNSNNQKLDSSNQESNLNSSKATASIIINKNDSLVFPPNKSVKADPLESLNISKYPDDYRNSFRINRISNLLGRIFNKKLTQIQNSKILQNISNNYNAYLHSQQNSNNFSSSESYYSFLNNNLNLPGGKMYDSLSPNFRRKAEIERISLDDLEALNKINKRKNSERSGATANKDYININNYEDFKNKFFLKYYPEEEEIEHEKEIYLNTLHNPQSPSVKEKSRVIDSKTEISISENPNFINKQINKAFCQNLSLVSAINLELNSVKKNMLFESTEKSSNSRINNTNIIINDIDEFIFNENNHKIINNITNSNNVFDTSNNLNGYNTAQVNKNYKNENLQISTLKDNIFLNAQSDLITVNSLTNAQEENNLNTILNYNLTNNNDDSEIIQNQILHNINLSIFSTINKTNAYDSNKNLTYNYLKNINNTDISVTNTNINNDNNVLNFANNAQEKNESFVNVHRNISLLDNISTSDNINNNNKNFKNNKNDNKACNQPDGSNFAIGEKEKININDNKDIINNTCVSNINNNSELLEFDDNSNLNIDLVQRLNSQKNICLNNFAELNTFRSENNINRKVPDFEPITDKPISLGKSIAEENIISNPNNANNNNLSLDLVNETDFINHTAETGNFAKEINTDSNSISPNGATFNARSFNDNSNSNNQNQNPCDDYLVFDNSEKRPNQKAEILIRDSISPNTNNVKKKIKNEAANKSLSNANISASVISSGNNSLIIIKDQEQESGISNSARSASRNNEKKSESKHSNMNLHNTNSNKAYDSVKSCSNSKNNSSINPIQSNPDYINKEADLLYQNKKKYSINNIVSNNVNNNSLKSRGSKISSQIDSEKVAPPNALSGRSKSNSNSFIYKTDAIIKTKNENLTDPVNVNSLRFSAEKYAANYFSYGNDIELQVNLLASSSDTNNYNDNNNNNKNKIYKSNNENLISINENLKLSSSDTQAIGNNSNHGSIQNNYFLSKENKDEEFTYQKKVNLNKIDYNYIHHNNTNSNRISPTILEPQRSDIYKSNKSYNNNSDKNILNNNINNNENDDDHEYKNMRNINIINNLEFEEQEHNLDEEEGEDEGKAEDGQDLCDKDGDEENYYMMNSFNKMRSSSLNVISEEDSNDMETLNINDSDNANLKKSAASRKINNYNYNSNPELNKKENNKFQFKDFIHEINEGLEENHQSPISNKTAQKEAFSPQLINQYEININATSKPSEQENLSDSPDINLKFSPSQLASAESNKDISEMEKVFYYNNTDNEISKIIYQNKNKVNLISEKNLNINTSLSTTNTPVSLITNLNSNFPKPPDYSILIKDNYISETCYHNENILGNNNIINSNIKADEAFNSKKISNTDNHKLDLNTPKDQTINEKRNDQISQASGSDNSNDKAITNKSTLNAYQNYSIDKKTFKQDDSVTNEISARVINNNINNNNNQTALHNMEIEYENNNNNRKNSNNYDYTPASKNTINIILENKEPIKIIANSGENNNTSPLSLSLSNYQVNLLKEKEAEKKQRNSAIKITSIARSRSKERRGNKNNNANNEIKRATINTNTNNHTRNINTNKLVNKIFDSPNIKVIKTDSDIDEKSLDGNEKSFSEIHEIEINNYKKNITVNKYKRNINSTNNDNCSRNYNSRRIDVAKEALNGKKDELLSYKKALDKMQFIFIKNLQRKMLRKIFDEIVIIDINKNPYSSTSQEYLENTSPKIRCTKHPAQTVIPKSKNRTKERHIRNNNNINNETNNQESDMESSPVSIHNYQDTIDIETSLIKQMHENSGKTKLISSSIDKKTNEKSELSLVKQENFIIKNNNQLDIETIEPEDLDNNSISSLSQTNNQEANLNNFNLNNNSNLNSISYLEVYSNTNDEIIYYVGEYVIEKQVYLQLNSIGPKKTRINTTTNSNANANVPGQGKDNNYTHGNSVGRSHKRNQDFCFGQNNYCEPSELENITEYIELENMSSLSKSQNSNLNNTGDPHSVNYNVINNLSSEILSPNKNEPTLTKLYSEQIAFNKNKIPINNFNSNLLSNNNSYNNCNANSNNVENSGPIKEKTEPENKQAKTPQNFSNSNVDNLLDNLNNNDNLNSSNIQDIKHSKKNFNSEKKESVINSSYNLSTNNNKSKNPSINSINDIHTQYVASKSLKEKEFQQESILAKSCGILYPQELNCSSLNIINPSDTEADAHNFYYNINNNNYLNINRINNDANSNNKPISSSNSPLNLSGRSFNSSDSKDKLKSLSARIEKLKKAKSDIIEKNKKIIEENNKNKKLSLNLNSNDFDNKDMMLQNNEANHDLKNSSDGTTNNSPISDDIDIENPDNSNLFNPSQSEKPQLYKITKENQNVNPNNKGPVSKLYTNNDANESNCNNFIKIVETEHMPKNYLLPKENDYYYNNINNNSKSNSYNTMMNEIHNKNIIPAYDPLTDYNNVNNKANMPNFGINSNNQENDLANKNASNIPNSHNSSKSISKINSPSVTSPLYSSNNVLKFNFSSPIGTSQENSNISNINFINNNKNDNLNLNNINQTPKKINLNNLNNNINSYGLGPTNDGFSSEKKSILNKLSNSSNRHSMLSSEAKKNVKKNFNEETFSVNNNINNIFNAGNINNNQSSCEEANETINNNFRNKSMRNFKNKTSENNADSQFNCNNYYNSSNNPHEYKANLTAANFHHNNLITDISVQENYNFINKDSSLNYNYSNNPNLEGINAYANTCYNEYNNDSNKNAHSPLNNNNGLTTKKPRNEQSCSISNFGNNDKKKEFKIIKTIKKDALTITNNNSSTNYSNTNKPNQAAAQFQQVNNSNRNLSERKIIANNKGIKSNMCIISDANNILNSNNLTINSPTEKSHLIPNSTNINQAAEKKLKIFKSNPNFSNNKITNIIKKIKNRQLDETTSNNLNILNNTNNTINNFSVTSFANNNNNNNSNQNSNIKSLMTSKYIDNYATINNLHLNNTVSGNLYEVSSLTNKNTNNNASSNHNRKSKSGNKNITRKNNNESANNPNSINNKSLNIFNNTNILETANNINESYLHSERSSTIANIVNSNCKSTTSSINRINNTTNHTNAKQASYNSKLNNKHMNFNNEENTNSNDNADINLKINISQSNDFDGKSISENGDNIGKLNKTEFSKETSNQNLVKHHSNNVFKIIHKNTTNKNKDQEQKNWSNIKLKKEKSEVKINYMITPKYVQYGTNGQIISNIERSRINSSKEKVKEYLNTTSNKNNPEDSVTKNPANLTHLNINHSNNLNMDISKNLTDILNKLQTNINENPHNNENHTPTEDIIFNNDNKVSLQNQGASSIVINTIQDCNRNNINNNNSNRNSLLRNVNTSNLINNIQTNNNNNNNNFKKTNLKSTVATSTMQNTGKNMPQQVAIKFNNNINNNYLQATKHLWLNNPYNNVRSKNKNLISANVNNNEKDIRLNCRGSSLVLDKCIENLKIALDNYIRASQTDKDLLKNIIRDNLSSIKKENELQKSLYREKTKAEEQNFSQRTQPVAQTNNINLNNSLNSLVLESNENTESLQGADSDAFLKQIITSSEVRELNRNLNNNNAINNTTNKNGNNNHQEAEENDEVFDENEFNRLSDDPDDIKHFIIQQLESFKLGLVKDRLEKYFERLRDENASPRSDV